MIEFSAVRTIPVWLNKFVKRIFSGRDPRMDKAIPTGQAAPVHLSPEEWQRYARHLSLPQIGTDGQKRLKAARVLIIGLGGLGSPAAMYLAAAGVGHLGLVDFDRVDASNLQRQLLHGTDDIGRLKVESAKQRLIAINPFVDFRCYPFRLEAQNIRPILNDYDLVIDGTDNFAARYLINDACVMTGKPNVHGSIYQFEGQVSIFAARIQRNGAATGKGPCYRCLYPEPPPPHLVPTCAEAGVLGVLPGIIGSIQAMEAIKRIVDCGDPLIGRILVFDGLRLAFQELSITQNPACAICGDHPSIKELRDYSGYCQFPSDKNETITVPELKSQLDAKNRLILLDVRERFEYENHGHIPDAMHIALDELTSRLEELPRGRPIVAYCASGARSQAAVNILKKYGFNNVYTLDGGMNQWNQ